MSRARCRQPAMTADWERPDLTFDSVFLVFGVFTWKGLDIAEIHLERPVYDLHLMKYGFVVELAVRSNRQIEGYDLLDRSLLRAEETSSLSTYP